MRSSQDTPDPSLFDAIIGSLLIAALAALCLQRYLDAPPPADPFPFTAEDAQGGR